MHLYIANGTQQVVEFLYRLPENDKLLMQRIPIGSQIKIVGDLSQPQVDAIINQHAMYGLVRADEIDQTKPYIGLCYAVDKPVPPPKIAAMHEHNNEVLTEQGRETRQQAALATNNHLEVNAPTAGLQELEVTITEEPSKGGDKTGPLLSETTLISRTANHGENKPRPRKGRR